MKRYSLIIFLLFSSLMIKAQDTIVKRSGEKVVVKLMEVNIDNVKFKRMDNLEGPLYTMTKQEISFILYANGTKESFENYFPPTPKPEFHVQDLTIQQSGKYFYYKERLLHERDMLAVAKNLNDNKINLMIKTVERDRFIQNITLGAAITCEVTGLVIYSRNRGGGGGRGRGRYRGPSAAQLQGQKNGEYLMLAGLGCEIASIYFIFDRRKNDRILVGAYNQLVTIH